jgi:hypothetical protein
MNVTSNGIALPGAAAVPRGHGPDALTGSRSRVQELTGHLGVLSVFVQLVLVSITVRHLDLLTSALRRTLYLAALAFVVNHYLPARYRMRAVAVLCGVTLLLVMGGSPDRFWDGAAALQRAVPMMVVGGAFIVVCLLPIGFWTRAALVGTLGVVVGLFRAGVIGMNSLALVWPVLAGLFMFRVMVFLYETSTLRHRPRASEAFGYFFLAPNISATLFPVVGFKTFVRSHYDGDAVTIYQRGARWIVRGVVQLVVYRVVQQLFAIRPDQVASGAELVQFVLTNVFLYVKVSGQFHIFVGLLLLFGFNLPETNRRYFLASSFTDYWRRVNIYWKDFILTVFYYPTYFRLKHRGATQALVIATLWSFFVTWALHLYQTWWLKGTAAMTWTDALFWLILALLVLANSLWETKHGRRRTLGSSPGTLRRTLGLLVRTAGTFVVVSVLWSLWSTPTLSQWIGLWRFADAGAAFWALAAVASVMLATLLFEVLPSKRPAAGTPAGAVRSAGALGRSFAQCALPLGILVLLGSPALQARFDAEPLQPWYDAINAGESLTEELVPRNGGYYERLLKIDAADTQLWETMMGLPVPPFYAGADPIRRLKDVRFREFLPNVHLQAYDTEFRTNRWGMRDREYTLVKPPGTLRVALVGSSHSMGWGVTADEVFEAIVERRLNLEQAGGGERYEILNFSQNGQSPLGEIVILDERVAAFGPDVVLLVAHTSDYPWLSRDVSRALREGIPMPDGPFARIVRETRVTARTHGALAGERLQPYEPEMLEWSYRRIVERVLAMDAVPMAVFLPLPSQVAMNVPQAERQISLLRSSGFAVIDGSHVFDGERSSELMLPDSHSNAKAHALIAGVLYEALTGDPELDLPRRAGIIARPRGEHRTEVSR